MTKRFDLQITQSGGKTTAVVSGVILLVLASVAFGPGLLRRDVERYEWDRAIGEGVLTDPIGIAYGDGP